MADATAQQYLSPIFGEMFDSIFGKKPEHETDDLALRIAEETDRALHSQACWLQAYSSLDDATRARLIPVAMIGDDMQFGIRLAQAMRRQVIAEATKQARKTHHVGKPA